ncbi:hypothetical protein [Sphingomonas morindae]|uniref:Uncharacterized protein n=1 Tax=Sphingomonas morindae TaxID=1541170 RepID=A0ABY4XDV6_9SPHN|nr:hypothetical protein [Sphingomonas morindae]USI74901.1 hypothetical protein LHA26_17160 [Sphingomonas morindae]
MMASAVPFILFESSLGRIVRSMQPEGLHASLNDIPIVFEVTMAAPLRQRFRQSPVLNNDVQLKLAAAIRDVIQREIFPFINDNSRADPALRARVAGVFQRATPRLQAIVVEALGGALRGSAAWRDYRLDSGKEIARIGLTLTFVAVAAGLAPPTSGVSIAFLIVSLVRGLTDATKKFSEAYRTAEESRARLLAEIQRLRAAYAKGQTTGRAAQLGGALAHALTLGKMAASFNSDPLPGFTRIKTELNAYKGKLGHLNARAEQLGRRLYELLDLIEQYEAEQGDAGQRPRLARLRRDVTGLLEDGVRSPGFRGRATISGAWTRCQTGLAELALVENQFKALKALETREGAIVRADRVVTLLTNLAVTLAGYNAPLGLQDRSGAAIEAALKLAPGHPGPAAGGTALGLGFMRQFMSLFKDSHALAKELGLVGKKPDAADQLLAELEAEFRRPPAPEAAPRLPNLSFPAALEIVVPGAPPIRMPPPTRPPPPVPTS